MKHTLKIVILLLGMFLLAQLVGLAVSSSYYSQGQTSLPSWIEPPKDVSPAASLGSIIFAIILGVVIMLVLMNYKIKFFLRIWFFAVVVIALALTLNALFLWIPGISNLSFTLALLISIPLAYLKVYIRNTKIHNLTELMIYPGIAALFISLLNVGTVVILLILISIYDIYAVWHAGFMQKMAKYQIKELKFFSGFFVPYTSTKDNIPLSKSSNKKVKVNVAILGGGDVIFPIILAGTVLIQYGLIGSLLISLGATLALAFLFYKSEKGKFYPAMPFITFGCLVALIIAVILKTVVLL